MNNTASALPIFLSETSYIEHQKNDVSFPGTWDKQATDFQMNYFWEGGKEVFPIIPPSPKGKHK